MIDRATAARLVWWSLGASLVLVILLWVGWRFAGGQTMVGDAAFGIFLPALVVAAFLSGNVHDLNPIIWFMSQVVQTFLMIYIVLVAITVGRRFHRR